RHCALPAQALAEGLVDASIDYRSATQWQDWLRLIQDLYGIPIESFRIRNPQGCPSCKKQHVIELNGYAGRTVVAETIEPALFPTFLHGIRHGGYPLSALGHDPSSDPNRASGPPS